MQSGDFPMGWVNSLKEEEFDEIFGKSTIFKMAYNQLKIELTNNNLDNELIMDYKSVMEQKFNEGKKIGKIEGFKEGESKGLEKGKIEGLEKGKTEGLKIGRYDTCLEIAKELKRRKVEIKEIAEITKLDESLIKSFKS